MLIVAGTLTIEPAHRDEMLEAVRPMVETTRKEAGCREYTFTADPYEPSVVHLFELWDSQTALDQHFASDHMASWRERSAKLPITGRDISKFEISSIGPVR